MLTCHRTSTGNLVGWHQFVWELDWTGGANDAAKGFVTSISAESSTPIGVLVADSNQMQCQLLVSALRRRPELQITSCILDPNVILHAIDSMPVQVAVLN